VGDAQGHLGVVGVEPERLGQRPRGHERQRTGAEEP
jgi:hypothetical protein